MNNRKAVQILREAINHVPYYQKLAEKINFGDVQEETFFEFPPLKKQDVLDNPDLMISDEYKNQKIKQLRVERTSGSTGLFMNVFWNPEEFYQSNLNVWRLRKKWYNISPFSKCLSFSTLEYAGSRVYKPEEIDFDYSQRSMYVSKQILNDLPIETIDSILSFDPEWIRIQPSILVRLTTIMKKKDVTFPSLRYIELLGEMTMPSFQKSMEEYWHVPVTNMYGATEVNTIALECPHHRLHVLEHNVYLEPYKIDEKKSILVTGLHNTAMPIIRYVLGDELTLHNSEKCSCGVESSYISEIKGRTTDSVVLEGDKYASPYLFVFCIDKINSILNRPIVQFKIVQKTVKEICLYLVIEESYKNWEDTIRNELLDIIQESCGDLELNYSIMFLKEIKSTGNKFKFFECSPELVRKNDE